jgi:hypothetical protein
MHDVSVKTLEKFFEASFPPVAYDSWRRELAAVRSGAKRMARYVFLEWQVESGDDLYESIVRDSDRLGLIVIHERLDEQQAVAIYVVAPDQAWRAQALSLLGQVEADMNLPWSEWAEAVSSRLLGYRPKETAEWFDYRRWSQAAWDGRTVFLLLTKSQRDSIAACGGTMMPREALAPGLLVFWYRGHKTIKPEAVSLVPRGYTIARVAITYEAFFAWFASDKASSQPGLFTSLLTSDHLRSINSVLKSRIEMLKAGRWIGVCEASELTFPAVVNHSRK